MVFTLEQNVQGAAAYEQAIDPTPNIGLTLAGNFLEGLGTFAKSQARQVLRQTGIERRLVCFLTLLGRTLMQEKALMM